MADGSLTGTERDLIRADLGQLLELLGLGDYARPESPHEVFGKCLAEVRRVRDELEHAKSAAAGSHEGIRLWMLDCGNLVQKHREHAVEASVRLGEMRERADAAEAKLAAAAAHCRTKADWVNMHCPDLGRPAEALVKVADILAITGGEAATSAEEPPGEDGDAQEPHADLLGRAWGVIANAGWDASSGRVDVPKPEGWHDAALQWRDDYHHWLDLHLHPSGYQTWEQLALGLVRERDALLFEVAELQRALRDAASAKEVRAEAAESDLGAILPLGAVHAYLEATGWTVQSQGAAGSLWERNGVRIGVPDDEADPNGLLLGVISRIAHAEGRTPDETAAAITAAWKANESPDTGSEEVPDGN